MKTTKHTKLPWKIERSSRFSDQMQITSSKRIIVIMDFARAEDQANTDFIVKAVNAYDNLIEICKDAVHLGKTAMTKKQVQFHADRARELLEIVERQV